MGNLKDILENIYYVEDLKEIAEEVNKNDFLGIVSDEEFEYCPGHMELCNTEDCDEGCWECWENAIKNIKFKGEHNMKNKIDYDREYNIHEVFKFDEGIEFKHNNYMYRIMEGLLEVKYYNTNKEWIQCNCIDKCIINAKFKLVKKDKKVEFIQAIQAYNEYKTIKCIWLDYIYEFEYKKNEANLINLEEDRLLNLILEGEWYIKED